MKKIVLGALALILFGCQSAEYKDEAPSAKTQSEPMEAMDAAMAPPPPPANETEEGSADKFISSSAARVSKDSSRKFIRTAQLKFRTKNVLHSTLAIERIADKHDGFVSLSNLQNRIDWAENTRTDEDTTTEVIHYTGTCTMQLRVPVAKLDTVLKEIALQIDFLDFRIIKADDVSLQFLANKIAQNRSQRHSERLNKAIDEKGKRLNDVVDAEDSRYDKEEQSDQAKLNNLSLDDRARFSTIDIELYQRQQQKYQQLPYKADLRGNAYEPGFFSKLGKAFGFGWDLLLDFFIVVAKLWWIILLGLLIGFGLKRLLSKKS